MLESFLYYHSRIVIMEKSLLERTVDKAAKILPERVPSQDLLVDNIIIGRSFFRKTNCSTIFNDMSFYLAIIGQGDSGFAYFNPDGNVLQSDELSDYVNKNVFEAVRQAKHLPLKTVLSDAAIGIYNRSVNLQPHQIFKAEGSYASKAALRAELLTSDIISGENVLLVGAVSEIAREILAKNGKLRITDLSRNNENNYLCGIATELTNGKTLERMQEADVAIITGATFSSGTVDEILTLGNQCGTKMIFYLETANNLGPHLIEEGAVKVIAEKFPFYDMPGTTIMEVYTHD